MDVLSRLQAEFERALADSEAAVLLRLVRARSSEFTIGDLVALLETPHGACLQAHPVVELFREGLAPARLLDPPGEHHLQALFATIQRAEQPIAASALAKIAGYAPGPLAEQLDALVAVGLIVAAGDGSEPRYFAVAGDPGRPKTPVLVLAAFVLAILRSTGRRMQLLELLEATGCSEERVRRAIQHLKRTQKVTCTGQNSGTRYGLPE
jgi:hypothetical protein